MAKRDQAINTYVSETTKTEVEERARQADKSVSTYVADLIRHEMRREASDNLATETRAEERLEELIALGKDEMRQTAREIANIHSKTGTYAAANFELLKRDFSDTRRRDALATGSCRVRQPLDETLSELQTPTESAEERTPDDESADSEGSSRRSLDERLGSE
jgi:hypothetical protein